MFGEAILPVKIAALVTLSYRTLLVLVWNVSDNLNHRKKITTQNHDGS